MMGTTYCVKLSTLGLLHDSAGQPEKRLIPPQHAHNALDAVAHTRPLQHTGNCTLCLLLDLQHAQKLEKRCPFAQQSLFILTPTICCHTPLTTGGSYNASLLQNLCNRACCEHTGDGRCTLARHVLHPAASTQQHHSCIFAADL